MGQLPLVDPAVVDEEDELPAESDDEVEDVDEPDEPDEPDDSDEEPEPSVLVDDESFLLEPSVLEEADDVEDDSLARLSVR